MSRVIKDQVAKGAALKDVLRPVDKPKERHRNDCPLCEYVRREYPNVETGEQLQAAISEQFTQSRAIGLSCGREEATEQVSAFYRAQLDEIKYGVGEVVRESLAALEAYRAAAEEQLLALALAIARRIIGDTVTSSEAATLHVVREALSHVMCGNRVLIRVNLNGLSAVRNHREELMAALREIRSLDVIDDPRIGPGGCIVETKSGSVDARIETQLAEIETALNREAA